LLIYFTTNFHRLPEPKKTAAEARKPAGASTKKANINEKLAEKRV
jgi:hypothetical protein